MTNELAESRVRICEMMGLILCSCWTVCMPEEHAGPVTHDVRKCRHIEHRLAAASMPDDALRNPLL